ncbi:MAG TPA: HAMP domain-containing sensor histidine kinase, partial [Streptosporangiaceae bacterium]
ADPTAQFVATVSHELRTPLTSIISFLELIRAEDDRLTPDGRHFLDIIQRTANRLLRLVGDLLLLSRIESGISPPELVPVSVPELACEAVRNAAPAAAGFGVTLEAETGDGPQMPGDHLGLTQVLDNLIANAVKFSHPGDTVRVRAAWSDGYWRIEVADQGIGIPPDEIDRLFHRFVRASNARTSGRPGTGLGLSVVKAIVELHRGTVTVDSALEQGTTFSIRLPAPAVRLA